MICSWRRSCTFPQMRKTSAYLDSQQDAVIWASIERNSDAEGDTRFGWNHAEARGQARSRPPGLPAHCAGSTVGSAEAGRELLPSRVGTVSKFQYACRAVEIFGLFFLECAVTNGAFGAAFFFFARLLFLFFDFQLFSMSNEFFSDKFPATRFTMRKAW